MARSKAPAATEDVELTVERDDANNVTSRDVARYPEREIALRSGHTDLEESDRFVRVFSVETKHLGSDDEALHRRNSVAVLQEAIQQGLHPRGEVSFDGVVDQAEDEPGYDVRYPLSHLTYSVQCVPAGIDPVAADTTTPGVALDAMGGSTEK